MGDLVYCVAVSLDGFIARDDDGFDELVPPSSGLSAIAERLPETLPGVVREHLAPGRPNRRFETVVMGRRTYEIGLAAGLSDPYPSLRTYVVTSEPSRVPGGGPEVLSGDPRVAIRELKVACGGDIWLCGGGTLAASLAGEIDELLLKRRAVVLGSGVPLFAGPAGAGRWERTSSEALDGLEMATYRRA